MELVLSRENGRLTREILEGKVIGPASLLLDFLAVPISRPGAMREFAGRWGFSTVYALRKHVPGEGEYEAVEMPGLSLSPIASPDAIVNLEREQAIMRDAFFSWIYCGSEVPQETMGFPHVGEGRFVERDPSGRIVGPLGTTGEEKTHQRASVYPLPSPWVDRIIKARTANVSFVPIFLSLLRPKFQDIHAYRRWLAEEMQRQQQLSWKLFSEDVIALAWFELFACLEWGLAGKVAQCNFCGRFFLHTGRSTRKYCPACQKTAPGKVCEAKRKQEFSEEILRRILMLYRRIERGKISLEDYNNWRLEHGFEEFIPRKNSKVGRLLAGRKGRRD